MLTHSYSLISKLATLKGVSFFGMEEVAEEKVVFGFDGITALSLTRLFSLNTQNDCDKTLFASTVLRETIDNYIKPGYLSKNKVPTNDIKDKLLSFKSDLEWLYRHYKTNKHTFKTAAEYIEEHHSDVINLFSDSLIGALITNKLDTIIADYVLEFEPKNKFINLLDYITQKYLYSLRVRFHFEKNCYDALDDEFKER